MPCAPTKAFGQRIIIGKKNLLKSSYPYLIPTPYSLVSSSSTLAGYYQDGR